jgi:hypothetical protein
LVAERAGSWEAADRDLMPVSARSPMADSTLSAIIPVAHRVIL